VIRATQSPSNDGETVVGSGVVASDGTWVITSDMLSLGAHTLTATETDAAGNISDVSAAFSLTIVPATVAVFLADQTTLDTSPGFAVADTAADISAALNQLDDPNIGSITISDSSPITLAVAQLTSDSTAISKLQNANATPYQLDVTDTAANVAGDVDTLNADANVTSITLTDGGTPTLTLSVARALNDTAALGKIVGPYLIAISDTAADVAANFDALNADTHIASISLTDAGTPLLDLTDAEATGDASALAEIANPIFEVLAPDIAPTYYVNGGSGEPITGAGLIVLARNSANFAVGGNGAGGTDDLVEGSGVTVSLLADSRMYLIGENDAVMVAAASNLGFDGSDDSAAATSGDGIWVNSGTGDTIAGAGFTIYAAAGTGFTVGGNGSNGTDNFVDGSGADVTLEASSRLSLEGSNDVVTVGSNSNLGFDGSGDSFAATAGDGIWVNSGAGDTIAGAGFTIYAAAGTVFTVGGNGSNGTDNFVDGSGANVTLEASSRLTLEGSNNVVTIGSNSNLGFDGSDDSFAATTGDGIWVNSGAGDTIAGAGFTIYAAAGTGFTLGGNGSNGADNFVDSSGANVTLEASSRLSLEGSNDLVTIGSNSNLGFDGSDDSFAATTGDGIWVNSGAGDTIAGAGFTIYAAAGTGFTVGGTGDVAYAGLDDAITDGGSSTVFVINSNVGALSISGLGTDTTGVIDLLGGVGGYSTAALAFAALTSDGRGGSLLSLGSDGSIDLLGAAPSALRASNFSIG
jgi:hypothetical protein